MSTTAAQQRPLGLETNGINVISEDERKGSPRSLFWPWFAANISVLGLSYGAYVLGFGISFWQACVAGLIGIVVSFLLVGFIAVAGKRGSAPTLVLSRAAFGVQGNKLPALVSWILNVGWEIVLTVLATLATATVFHRLGWSSGDVTKVIAFLVITVLIVGSAALGFDTIMRLQTVITVVTGILTVIYFILVADKIHWATVSALHSGSAQAFLGATVLVATGFGLGWVNTGADYSRYLPRRTSGARGGVVDDVRCVDRADLPARVRAAARRVLHVAVERDQHRPDRCARHHPADLVPGAVRHRRGARPRRRRGA